MRKRIIIFLCICVSFHANAQLKRELRGAWVATVSNVDWPSSSSLTAAQQKAEAIAILNNHKQAGINAVYLQVRGECDAIYSSTLEPWSRVLTGTQGVNPGYDPLAFWIDECHKRGMEFHAWFNPYRAATNINNVYAATHVTKTNTSLLLSQNTLRILDPGKPAVWTYVLKVIMDVLRRYDVDGIHFDDYFYPYPPSTGTVYNDNTTFSSFSRGFTDKAAWRRANIDTLIKRSNDSIHRVKPWVKFGVSPFGIWRNQSSSSLGSATSGLESYSVIYADSKKWLDQQWVDYLMPQLYWTIGYAPADFGVLIPWWNNIANGRHIYAGIGLYKLGNPSFTGTDPNWNTNKQVPSQIRLYRNSSYPNFKGSSFFSALDIVANPLSVRDTMMTNTFFKIPSLIPTMLWRDNISPAAPSGLTANVSVNTVNLNWIKPATTTDEMQKVKRFVVYRSTTTPVNTGTSLNIRTVTNTDVNTFSESAVPAGTYYYTVVSVDRLYNESVVSNTVKVVVTNTLRLIDINATYTEQYVKLNWKNLDEEPTQYYELERSTDGKNFESIHKATQPQEGFDRYYFTDKMSNYSGYQYRVKQTLLDGSILYSKVVDNNRKNNLLSTYPNPTSGMLMINSNAQQTVTITNSYGMLVMKVNVKKGKTTINLSSLSSGMYYIKDEEGNMNSIIKE